jgi:hypothetical protein
MQANPRVASMSSFERLLVPDSAEGPECRCGEEMLLARTDGLSDRTDSQIRNYKCASCSHEMRLTVWVDN